MGKRVVWYIGILLIVGFIFVGCAQDNGLEGTYEPGTYEAQADGHNGSLSVKVEVDESSIVQVEVTENSETENIASTALEEIPKQIVDTQSLSVDTISGATSTSKAIIEATKTALLEAGATEEELNTEKEETEKKVEQLKCDVVVAGAGGSGVSAAVTAAENGAEVIVLEKTAMVGGTTANGGGFFAADSQKARDLGHEPVDTDLIFEMWMDEMDWMSDAVLVKQFLELSHTTADWMEEHGIIFHKTETAVQQSHAEGTNGYHKYDDYTKTSEQLTAMVDAIVENNDAKILYETPATELLIENDQVTGIVAEGKDTIYEITANSVVLATGGFVGNEEMVREALGGVSVNASGYNSNVGDGINMGLAQNAATRSMKAMVLHTFTIEGGSKVEGDYEFMDLYQATNSLAYMPIIPWLDPNGTRFANEDIVYDRALSTNSLVSRGNYGWFLYNEELLNTLEENGAGAAGMEESIAMGPMPDITPLETGWGNLTEIVQIMVDNGDVKKADTLTELAEMTGMDKTMLQETMTRYNEDASKGKDSQFGKRSAHMFEMAEGPYYAFKITPNNLSTAGGLRINSNFQVVLDDPENGYTPIGNLFAAGADAGGLYSDHYAHTIEGAAQGWAYNSGRLAGARATENALDKEVDLLK
ncbi:MAG TPA: hypothetical protein DHN33_10270 [Eubacteriaceae bacterium]|nr:hypothetical protein [Eubacteriaceae bacterium]